MKTTLFNYDTDNIIKAKKEFCRKNSNSYKEELEFLKELGITEAILNEGKISKAMNKAGETIDNTGKTVSKAAKAFKDSVKNLYSTDEKNLKSNTPQLSKALTRGIITLGLAATTGPLLAIIHHFTGVAMKNKNDAESREKLCDMYKTKLEYIEDKISKTDDSKEKYKLIEVRNTLTKDINKIKVVKD